MRFSILLCCLVISFGLSGCATKLKDFFPSDILVKQQWKGLEEKQASEEGGYPNILSKAQIQIEKGWWQSFRDPILNNLVDKALLGNKDIQTAKARVEQARAARSLASAELTPEINATGGASRSNQSTFASISPFNTAQGYLQASWELDLFGQNQYRLQQAEAILQSEEANNQAIIVSLLAEVASTYFDLINYKSQIQIIEESLKGQKNTLSMVRSLRKESMATELDLQRSGAQVSTTEAQLPDVKHAYNAAITRLNILTGEPPGTIDAMFISTRVMHPLTQILIISAPANVIANRPDVKVAERQFASRIAAQNVAKAEIFPKISLSALFGLQSNAFVSYNPFSLGMNAVQPLLNFGRIESQIDVADTVQKQAFYNYQKTVLEALEDMENALSSYLNETSKNKSLKEAVEKNQKSLQLVKQQFKEGYTDILNVETVERNLLQSNAELARSNVKLRKDMVAIYTAAGGGWSLENEP